MNRRIHQKLASFMSPQLLNRHPRVMVKEQLIVDESLAVGLPNLIIIQFLLASAPTLEYTKYGMLNLNALQV